MCEIDQTKLAQEIIAYRFPEGGEYIRNQIARHQKMFKTNHPENKQDLLEDNEELYINDGIQFITGRDDNGKLTYMARYHQGGILSQSEIKEIYESNHQLVIFVIHHTDLDGCTAAAIASRAFQNIQSTNKSIVFYHYKYNSTVLRNLINRVQQFDRKTTKLIGIVLDVCLNERELESINQIFDRMIFIDHHHRSLNYFAETKFPYSLQFTCLIDTRYSTAYLCYLLFKDIIKDRLHMEIDETFPAMVSAMDNAQGKVIQSPYISVKITHENKKFLKDIEYSINRNATTTYRLTDPDSMIGKYIMIKNELHPSSKDEFPNLSTCGYYLNSYFIEDEDLYPYRTAFYDVMLINRKAVLNVVNIGARLRELQIQRMRVLGYDQSIYVAHFMGLCIRGMLGSNFDNFSCSKAFRSAAVLIKYQTNTLLSCSVKTYESVLRNANINSVLNELFPDEKRKILGHDSMSLIYSSNRRIDHSYNAFQEKTLPIELVKKYPIIYEVFNNIHITDPMLKTRTNSTIRKFFIMVSTIICTVWQMKVQATYTTQSGK